MVKQKKLSPVAAAMLGETKRKHVKRLRDRQPKEIDPHDHRHELTTMRLDALTVQVGGLRKALEAHVERFEAAVSNKSERVAQMAAVNSDVVSLIDGYRESAAKLDKLTARVVGCEDANGDIHVRLVKLEADQRIPTLVEHDIHAAKRLDELMTRMTKLEHQAQDVYVNGARMPAPTPGKTKRDGWLNIYRGGEIKSFRVCSTKIAADRSASDMRVACVRIEWEE